jgi:hypothetical protein
MSRVLVSVLALMITIPAAGWAQERVGVATTVVGPVTITHASAPAEPLKFKDDILLNDRIATGDKALTRVLLGGKAIVTAREHSVVTINAIPGVSTIDLVSGRIAVAVDKAKMRAGEVVEIKTPNAIAGIRGTIVIAEAIGGVSTITVLRGLVDVYRRDPVTSNPVGPATSVGTHESVTVHQNVLPTKAQTISADTARRLSNQFTTPLRAVSPVATTAVGDEISTSHKEVGTLAGNASTSDLKKTPSLTKAPSANGHDDANVQPPWHVHRGGLKPAIVWDNTTKLR